MRRISQQTELSYYDIDLVDGPWRDDQYAKYCDSCNAQQNVNCAN